MRVSTPGAGARKRREQAARRDGRRSFALGGLALRDADGDVRALGRRAASAQPRTRSMRALSTLAVAGMVLAAPLFCWADYNGNPDVTKYANGLVSSHGFGRDWLTRVFVGATKQDSIIDAMSRPAEKVKPWHEYRQIFVTDKRIEAGIAFWQRHREAVAAAHKQYGVPGEVVVAIIGVETFYGRYLGSHRVIDALATLAFDYPPRAQFFRKELTEFLLLVREEAKDPFEPMGSYAGAMGFGQFIPSSYRAYAVDFDDDGRRDIWTNETDAIGSVANYFARHGWRGRAPAALQVGLADPTVAALANQGFELRKTVGEWRDRGVTGVDTLPADAGAALFRMQAEDGEQYWLGFHDFYVVTRYNRSAMYALAVLQLSERIRQELDAASAVVGG